MSNEPNRALQQVSQGVGGSREMARKLGVHRNTVLLWEQGSVLLPKERKKQIRAMIAAHVKELRELGRQI